MYDLLNSQPDQLVAAGVNSVEDYFDDAKHPETAAQVKFEVDMIAKWRREERPGILPQESETLRPTTSNGTCTGVGSPPASLSSTDEDQGFVIYAQDEQKFPDAKWREEKHKVDSANNLQEAEYLVGDYQIAYGQSARVWFENKRPEVVAPRHHSLSNFGHP